jgi:hypothetical protein
VDSLSRFRNSRNRASVPSVPHPEEQSSPRLSVLLAALVLAAIAPSVVALDGSWIFDDNGLIVTNPYVHGFEHWRHWFTSHFWDVLPEGDPPEQAIMFWRPLVLASYALDWTLGSGSSVVFHTTNVCLHVAATTLSFLLLRRWTGSPLASFFAVLVLAVHPFRSESVAWISGRPDPLMMVGILLAIQGLGRRLRGGKEGLPLEVVGTLVAYMSKEHAVVLPAIAFLETWFVARGTGGTGRYSLWIRACGPHVLVAVAYLACRHLLLPINPSGGGNWPIGVRIGVVLETLGRYVTVLAWPEDITLGAGLIQLNGALPELDGVNVTVGALAVLALLSGAIWGALRSPRLAVGLVALAAAMFPVSNVLSLGYDVFGSPRLLYLPSLPVAYLLALAIAAALNRGRRASLAVIGLVAVATAVLGGLHVNRALDYRNADRFWHVEAAKNPQYSHALQYFTLRSLEVKRPQEALKLAHLGFHNVRTTIAARATPKFILYALAAAVRLTPDLDQQSLLDIYRYLMLVRAEEAAELHLPRLGIAIRTPAGSRDSVLFRKEFGTLVLIEAASRTDNWKHVRDLAEALRTRSSLRPGIVKTLGTQAAQNHDTDFLEATIEQLRRDGFPSEALDLGEVMQFHNWLETAAPPVQASYYARLGAWGRAYQVLRPLVEPGEGAGGGIDEVLAEAAFRAGDQPTARRLLGSVVSSREAEARIESWSLSMQWTDLDLGGDREPLPDTLLSAIGAGTSSHAPAEVAR